MHAEGMLMARVSGYAGEGDYFVMSDFNLGEPLVAARSITGGARGPGYSLG